MKLKIREQIPNIALDLVNDTHWSLKEQRPEHFTMLIFYRGKHCPVCKKYLQELQSKVDKFTDLGINFIAISSDTEERAKESHKEWAVSDVPMGYDFSIEEARNFGLYISEGIKDSEPERFIEPGLFLVRPDGTLYSASIQSMPFARPEFDALLKSLDYIIKNDYPARGEA